MRRKADVELRRRVNGAKIQIAGWSVYVTTLWLVKASLCAFYTRLTVRPKILRGGEGKRNIGD